MGSLPALDSQCFIWWRGLSRRAANWVAEPRPGSISAQVISVTPHLPQATWIRRFRHPAQLWTNSLAPWLREGLTPRQWTTCSITRGASPLQLLRCPVLHKLRLSCYFFIWEREFHYLPSNFPQSLADSSKAGAADRVAAPLTHVPPCLTGSGALQGRRLLSALHSQQHHLLQGPEQNLYLLQQDKSCRWIPAPDAARGMFSCTHSPASTPFSSSGYVSGAGFLTSVM